LSRSHLEEIKGKREKERESERERERERERHSKHHKQCENESKRGMPAGDRE
jgi:hypothetical protein